MREQDRLKRLRNETRRESNMGTGEGVAHCGSWKAPVTDKYIYVLTENSTSLTTNFFVQLSCTMIVNPY